MSCCIVAQVFMRVHEHSLESVLVESLVVEVYTTCFPEWYRILSCKSFLVHPLSILNIPIRRPSSIQSRAIALVRGSEFISRTPTAGYRQPVVFMWQSNPLQFLLLCWFCRRSIVCSIVRSDLCDRHSHVGVNHQVCAVLHTNRAYHRLVC